MERHPQRQDQVLNLEELSESFEPITGQAVTLRALRREDHDIEHAFVSGLSADTRHNRLLAQQKNGPEAPTIEHWFPTTNGGIVGRLGPRDMASTGDQLWVAGEFTTVNGRSQWGPLQAEVRPRPAENPASRSWRLRRSIFSPKCPLAATNCGRRCYWRSGAR